MEPETVVELEALVSEVETDPSACVVVLKNADPEFFAAHIDVTANWTDMAPGKTGMHPLLDSLVRLSVSRHSPLQPCASALAGPEVSLLSRATSVLPRGIRRY